MLLYKHSVTPTCFGHKCSCRQVGAILGTYHTDNLFFYMLPYIIVSVGVLITPYTHLFNFRVVTYCILATYINRYTIELITC